ncbi:6-bladed beta-propeller [Candidatus Palauibacter sp.]|uniref:6-bladed beta-propeller n=1 Tax=Candidatus Palauibacter sp. TaxID=3101350 RepID=UPI003CC680C5
MDLSNLRMVFWAVSGLAFVANPEAALSQQYSIPALKEIGSFGVLTGDPALEFGQIIGIAAHEGIIYTIDETTHVLSAFTQQGEFLSSIGRRGAGPEEFSWPKSVVADASGVHVLDVGNARIARFRLESDTLRYVGQTRFPLAMGWDFCALEGDYFILKYDAGRGGLIQRLDREGNVEAFGRAFVEGDAMMASVTDFGLVVCDAAGQALYVVSNMAPTVRAYTAPGVLLWDVILPGKVVPIITRTEGGVQVTQPPSGERPDHSVSISVIPGGPVLVQYGESPRRGAPTQEIGDVTSVLFNAADGSVLATSDDLPRIDFSSNSFAYSYLIELFPRVTIYEWTNDG